jgi:hypothetical protein
MFACAAGGVPCDVTLKLPSEREVPTVSLFLQAASPFFRDALEDVQGSTVIPVSRLRTSDIVAVLSTITAVD